MIMRLFQHAGWVAWPLGICSVLALAIVLERIFTLSRLRAMEDEAFMMLQLALEKNDEGIMRDARIAAAPVTQVLTTLTTLRGASPEVLDQAAGIAVSLQRLRLRRYLTTLATIGSTAPFIGLFGTVLGVIDAFGALGEAGSKVATGISEALSATALGLLVAIPAVVAYNYLLGYVAKQVLHVQGHVARLVPLINAPERERQEA